LQRCRSLDRRDPDAFRDLKAEITLIPARLSMSRRVEPLPRQDGGVMPEIAAKPARPASWQTGFITCWEYSASSHSIRVWSGPGTFNFFEISRDFAG